MRKLLAVALVMLILISAQAAYSIQFPRQVDPNTAPADPIYGQGLYLFYGALFAVVGGGDFSGAQHLLKSAAFIHIPPEVSDAFNSFNRLVNSTSTLFHNIGHELKNASNFVATGRIANASQSLRGAIIDLRSANLTLTQLFEAAPRLAALTGIPPSLFLQKLQPLEVLYRSYTVEANHLLAVLTGLSKLEQPSITLVASPPTIETGSNVTVSGELGGADGSALRSRVVSVYFAQQRVGNATTDSSGRFAGSFRTPYVYSNTSMFASFVPTGKDILVYASASSREVGVRVKFSTPGSSVSAPRFVYAGQTLSVNGTLSLYGHPLRGYLVSLSAFKTAASSTTNSTGRFTLSFPVPSSAGEGTYAFNLRSAPNKTTGPLSALVRVLIIHEAAAVALWAPAVAFAGLPFTVSGSAVVNGTGLAGARVRNVSPSSPVNATTSSDGTFSFTVTPPMTTPNGGWAYTVGVYPNQSWVSPAPATVNVFVINPLVLIFPASSFGLLALVIRRRRAAVRAVVSLSKVEEAEEQPGVAPKPLAGLARIYSDAVEIVLKLTSVRIEPHMTVREYLGAVRGRFPGSGSFEYISLALETELYGLGASPEVQRRAGEELEKLRGET